MQSRSQKRRRVPDAIREAEHDLASYPAFPRLRFLGGKSGRKRHDDAWRGKAGYEAKHD